MCGPHAVCILCTAKEETTPGGVTDQGLPSVLSCWLQMVTLSPGT